MLTIEVIGQNIFEGLCGLFFTSIWEPASSILGFAGNPAPFSISNCAPKIASIIVLMTLRPTFRRFRNSESFNKSKVLSDMLFATIWEPASSIRGFAGNHAPLSVGNRAP